MSSGPVALDSVNKLFRQEHASNQEHVFSVELITSQRQLANQWNPAFKEIFTDKNDREPLNQLIDRFRNGENFFVLKDLDGNVKGISFPQILLSHVDQKISELMTSGRKAWQDAQEKELPLKPMYVPWVGVEAGVRNIGAGTRFDQAVADIMKVKYGVTHTLLDIEDPERLHQSGYPAEELPDAIKFAERRINYWKRQGFVIVNDDRLKYVRPSSENDQDIQAYDHMAIRFEDPSVQEKYLSKDGTKVDIEFVRQSYLDMSRIQYGDLTEQELRSKFPAVQHYLTELDNVMKSDRWLSLDGEAIVPKVTPNVFVELKLTAINQNHPNDPALAQNKILKPDSVLHKEMV